MFVRMPSTPLLAPRRVELSRSKVRLPRLLTAALGALALALGVTALPAQAITHDPPSQFGTDWDNPRTAGPPVKTPDTRHCSVQIVHEQFDDYATHTSEYEPPADCSGPWSKVVLRLDGSVAGRQYDRLGSLDIGGIRVLTFSTPEPSQDGISWHVEKDVTEYAPVLRDAQQVATYLGNTVNDTYTGVFDITVTLDFYVTDTEAPAASTADAVTSLTGGHREGSALVGTLTIPANTKRLEAEVYATGSGGGCEEFWDISAPASTGYSCPDGLPYREVDVSIDGRLAGIALPYPSIYTGGWSNPYLWTTIPAPRAFNLLPLRYDLTPFVGALTDGQPHEVTIRVVGLPEEQVGWWSLAPNLHVWTDPGTDRVTGTVTDSSTPDPVIQADVTGANDQAGSVGLDARRTFSVTGYVDTSAGRIHTTVRRTLHNTSDHTWTDGETHDELHARWQDDASVTTRTDHARPAHHNTSLTYTKDGYIDFVPHQDSDAADITTHLVLGDLAHEQATGPGVPELNRRQRDTYRGTATWTYNVPRDQRHATAETSERYVLHGDPAYRCFDHELATVNGYFTVDRRRC